VSLKKSSSYSGRGRLLPKNMAVPGPGGWQTAGGDAGGRCGEGYWRTRDGEGAATALPDECVGNSSSAAGLGQGRWMSQALVTTSRGIDNTREPSVAVRQG
jgi:hypothetical protein